MSCTITCSHMQTTVAKLPGGESDPPPDDNNHQPEKRPLEVQKDTKKKEPRLHNWPVLEMLAKDQGLLSLRKRG